jgi:protein farnesyltransferase subunit beta
MVNRQAMLSFLKSLKLPSGGFVMHEGGEEDLRAVYIVIVVAKLCGLLTNDLKKDVSDYIASC